MLIVAADKLGAEVESGSLLFGLASGSWIDSGAIECESVLVEQCCGFAVGRSIRQFGDGCDGVDMDLPGLGRKRTVVLDIYICLVLTQCRVLI